jgi:hypothetical protein
MAKVTRDDLQPLLDKGYEQARENGHDMRTWQVVEGSAAVHGSSSTVPVTNFVSACSSCSATVVVAHTMYLALIDPCGTAIDFPCPNKRT